MKEPEGMTPRERVKNAMDFKEVDAIPWCEVFYEETLLKFFSEGLPAHKMTIIEWTVNNDGFLLSNWPKFMGFDPNPYFGCTNLLGYTIPVDIGPIPRFKQRKIGEDARYEEYIMGTGARSRRFKKGASDLTWYSMPLFVEFPVKDKKSWSQYKERLNPEDPRRYPKDWNKDDYIKVLENFQDASTALGITGFYGVGAQLMGIPNFNLAFYRDPELIGDMVSHWEYFTIETVRDAVETLKDRIDLIFWWEDMAERHGPNISPKLYKKFLLPHYKRVTEFLNKNKIHRIMMDCDGNTKPILDLVIEAGITGHWPLEVNAGMDVQPLRKQYGKKLFLAGNLDKKEIAKGGEAMQKEIDSKIPYMKETGGYIAGLDHLVHVEFTLNRFKEYADYLKKKLPY
jgi:uroporphyrinogen decarboxylase